MAGVGLADIADLLGHKDLATTRIYAKVQQEHVRTVIGMLTGLVPTAVGFAPLPVVENKELNGFRLPHDPPNPHESLGRDTY
jgi:hypothetical protein